MPRRPAPSKPATAGGGMTPAQVKVRRRIPLLVLLPLSLLLSCCVVGSVILLAQAGFGPTPVPITPSRVIFQQVPIPQDQSYSCNTNAPAYLSLCGLIGDLVALNNAQTDAVLTKYKIEYIDATGKVLFPRL